jgi:predicted dehydrogenase
MGCHSIAVGRALLTPPGKPPLYLVPTTVSADIGLLKWGLARWRAELLERYGVDYGRTPAEDFATGTVTYRDPETGNVSKAQFTVSWMYDKQGLRLSMEAIGPAYALDVNTLRSPLELFIGDAALASVADAETALEKATATRGLLSIQPNEPDLYGYVDEHVEAAAAFEAGRSARYDLDYGLDIVRLTMACYLSAEERRMIDLADPVIAARLESYVPLVQQGRGGEVLGGR